MNKSLTKLREFRKLHNLCRDCGIVKESCRVRMVLCGSCADRKRMLFHGAPRKRRLPEILPLADGGSRATRMMELSAVLSKHAQSAHREQARGAA